MDEWVIVQGKGRVLKLEDFGQEDPNEWIITKVLRKERKMADNRDVRVNGETDSEGRTHFWFEQKGEQK